MIGVIGMILLVSLSGSGTNELISLIDAQAYFKHHQITVSAESMEKLAGADPTDGKTQVLQLLAIDWLGDNAADGKSVRATLESIAQGKKAQDAVGFAKVHAARALARLDGKAPPKIAALPAGSLRADAYRSFPDDVTLMGGFDLRASGSMKLEGDTSHLIATIFPETEALFEFVDNVGNMRVDRVSFAMHIPKDGDDADRTYIDIVGTGNLQWLMAFTQKAGKEYQKSERKLGTEKFNILASEMQAPAFAFIDHGDTQEVLMAGHKGGNAKHIELLDRAIEARTGAKPNALKGPQAELLKQVPEQAYAALVGELSDPIRKQLGDKLLKAAPKSIVLTARRDKEIHLEAQGTTVDEADAKQLVEGIEAGRKQALDFLKEPPPQAKLPKESRDLLAGTIKGAKVEAKGKSVTASIAVSVEAVQALLGWVKEQAAEEKKAP
jgi:hypothetical protein